MAEKLEPLAKDRIVAAELHQELTDGENVSTAMKRDRKIDERRQCHPQESSDNALGSEAWRKCPGCLGHMASTDPKHNRVPGICKVEPVVWVDKDFHRCDVHSELIQTSSKVGGPEGCGCARAIHDRCMLGTSRQHTHCPILASCDLISKKDESDFILVQC